MRQYKETLEIGMDDEVRAHHSNLEAVGEFVLHEKCN
jgi:hypothetical protein